MFCQELCEMKARNIPLLQGAGGSCVIYSVFRRRADLRNRTADALAFYNVYLQNVSSLFPLTLKTPLPAKVTFSP